MKIRAPATKLLKAPAGGAAWLARGGITNCAALPVTTTVSAVTGLSPSRPVVRRMMNLQS